MFDFFLISSVLLQYFKFSISTMLNLNFEQTEIISKYFYKKREFYDSLRMNYTVFFEQIYANF